MKSCTLILNLSIARDDLWYSIIVNSNFSAERVNLSFDIMEKMHHWENDCGEKCLLVDGYFTYGLQDMSSPHI